MTPHTGWSLTGNSGTTAGTNFVGTSDSVDFVSKTNGIERMRILAHGGKIGIGTSTPAQALDVNGSIQIEKNGSFINFNNYYRIIYMNDSLVIPNFVQLVANAGAGKVLTSDANGMGSWQTPGGGNLVHAISTPTTSATVTLNDNQINIISPAGTLAALTITFPNSPANKDFVEVTFDQVITSVTYAAGTGGATIKGQINGVVGGQKRWDYDTGTNTWY